MNALISPRFRRDVVIVPKQDFLSKAPPNKRLKENETWHGQVSLLCPWFVINCANFELGAKVPYQI